MTNKELHALGQSFLDKAGQGFKAVKVEDAKVVAVGDLVCLCMQMKAALYASHLISEQHRKKRKR